MPARNASITSSAVFKSPDFAAARRGSNNFVVRPMPISARNRVSSSSSHVASSMRPFPRMEAKAFAKRERVRPVRSRTVAPSSSTSTASFVTSLVIADSAVSPPIDSTLFAGSNESSSTVSLAESDTKSASAGAVAEFGTFELATSDESAIGDAAEDKSSFTTAVDAEVLRRR